MAYGVKYRLEFSDVLGYGKKVEILKKDYTGEVLPMVGTANPVTVKWNTKDDFYTSIIGSRCQLNLMVTDTVQYDDFYKFDEREYKVKVSFSKSKSQTYADRITEDAGFYESLECIDEFLGDFYTLSTFYEKRVQDDNGFVESLDCVSNAIIDEKYPIWDTYWIGWLVVDRFKETMKSFPYNISLNAYDGLGLLSNFDAPLSPDDSNQSGNTTPDNERISKILENLDLDLDIVFINDLYFKETGVSAVKYPNVTTFPNYLFELKNGFDAYTAKEQLSLLLTLYNMRIFQSYGKWYIVENSNTFDIRVKNNIKELNTNSNPPNNIRELINLKLKGGQTEFVEAEKINYLGVSQGVENVSTLKVAPKELRPIKNDLRREYLQPIIEVEKKLETKQYEKVYWNYNAGFEYGSYNWNINSIFGTPNATIVENEISKQGSFSAKLKQNTGFDYKCFETIGYNPTNPNPYDPDGINTSAIDGTKFTFSFFIEANNTLTNTFVKFKIVYVGANGTAYWNNSNNEFTSTDTLNSITVNNFNSWETITKTLKNEGIGGAGIRGTLTLEIWSTRTSTPDDYVNTYYDNVGIFQDGAEFIDFIWVEGSGTFLTGSKSIKSIRTDDLNYTSKKSYNSILFPTDSDSMQKKWYRSRDYNITGGTTTEFNPVSNITNQNIMNDFRNYSTRYEGSFRGLNPTPLSLHNRIWFNWPDVLEDPQSTILDGLSYNVKANEYKVLGHVPDDDNDLDVSIRITE